MSILQSDTKIAEIVFQARKSYLCQAAIKGRHVPTLSGG